MKSRHWRRPFFFERQSSVCPHLAFWGLLSWLWTYSFFIETNRTKCPVPPMATVRPMVMEASGFQVLPAHLMASAMEEFPQQLPVPKSPARGKSRSRRPREARFKTQPVTFAEIAEVEEEGSSPLEEERARRSFLQSLENLRRSTQTLHCSPAAHHTCASSPAQGSLDSSDSDSTQWDPGWDHLLDAASNGGQLNWTKLACVPACVYQPLLSCKVIYANVYSLKMHLMHICRDPQQCLRLLCW